MYSEDLEDIKDALVEQKSELRFENHVPNTQYKLPLDKKISINMNRDELEGLYDLVLMASNMIDIYSAIEVEAEG